MRFKSFMKSSLGLAHRRKPLGHRCKPLGHRRKRIGHCTPYPGLLIFLTFLLSSAENIAAQEPLYRDPEVVQKELKEKLTIKDEYIAKYPGQVSNYTERGEIYAGLCKLTRDDEERASYSERAMADFAKAKTPDLKIGSMGMWRLR
jgi:hypothetical protein